MDTILYNVLLSQDMKQVTEFCDKYPFYIGRKLYPILKNNKQHLPNDYVNKIIQHIRTFYKHERLFFDDQSSFSQKTAILTIHNRYD